MSTKSVRLSFHGGVGAVTGANFLLESEHDRLLVDCGLLQGRQLCDPTNHQPFSYNPATIDSLFVTHAHIDHTGRIGKLVRDGFTGTIYSTPETKALAEVMLADALHILQEEALACSVEPLYTAEDIVHALKQWKTIPYHTPTPLGKDFTVYLKDAGHILGSAIAELTHNESKRKIVFTGDLGNSPSPILQDTELVTDADYLIMESVYGDRNHESKEGRTDLLKDMVEQTIARKGTLLIPSFSVERTQVLLYELNNLIESGQLQSIPVFLDSPLAAKVTKIYQDARLADFNKTTQNAMRHGDDVFNFPGLKITITTEESKMINDVSGPKVVIAGSGMAHGGRIQYHMKRYLGDPANTFLIVGYQAVGSLGRAILDGAKHVTILGEEIRVRARVETILGYSAHKDSDGLVDFVSHTADSVKTVFVVMGEMKSSQFLAQRLRDYIGVKAVCPEAGSTVTLI